ncbi:MAG: hypothetical protein ACR2LX_07510 [Jatrophihabitans sp.]
MYCQTADFLAKKVLAKLDSGGLDPLPLARPSVATIDLCRTLSTSAAAALLLTTSADAVSEGFGNQCLWNGGAYGLSADATVSTEYSQTHAEATTVDGHRLIPPTAPVTAESPSCTYASPQGHIAVDNGEEFITVTATAANADKADLNQLCRIARHASVAILTNAGLR